MNQKDFFTKRNNMPSRYKPYFKDIYNINPKNFPAAFFSVIGIMAEDCNYHIKTCYSNGHTLYFEGYYYNHPSELMLHYGSSYLIVARVLFAHKRAGNMTKLFEVLKHIKRSYHLKKIIIESVITDEMKAWCQKNKFIPCGEPDDLGINWEWK